MVLVTASKLNLPQSPSSPPQILSANYEPNSRSLALTHSDSTLSLHSSISPISQPLATPQTLTLIPSPISSSAFVLLQSNSVTDSGTVEDPRVIFVVASPLKAGAAVCLRFYALKSSQVFSKVKVICKQKDCVFDDKSGGVVVRVNHGIAVRLSGSVNVFTMYSVSSSRIWVFALKMASDDGGVGGDGGVVKLMKCAVIECKVPVWSICVSYGYLILGEDNGIRVFALRPLVKGHGSKSVMYDTKHKGKPVKGKHMGHVFKMPNGAASNGGGIVEGGYSKLDDGHEVGAKFIANGMTVESHCNVHLEQKSNTHASVKLRSIRVGHESGMFKSFSILNSASLKSTSTQITTAKAISIKAMSANKFLILDSLGNLHLLSLSKLVGSKLNLQMRQLAQFMKVQKFDVFPGTQTVWLSDGFYTVQMIILGDVDPANNESSDHVNEGNPTVTGNQVIFTSEKIQDVVSLPANAVLIFGQGSTFLYAIS
ncbi:unnamed protein product [Rhodiola kirilowii]